nr:FAD-dependent oxidoreductase [Nocardia exalbida]
MAENRWTVSRRTLLRNTVAAGVAAGALAAGAVRPTPGAANPGGRRVAVLGGGVAGLTAAHELAERGFQVTVYEKRAWGGKARSVGVPGTGVEGRPDLPGEHGFRFFPGFYQHVPDTMRRIPFPGNANGVWDNLVAVPEARFARSGGDDFRVPLGPRSRAEFSPDSFRETLGAALSTALKMPPTRASTSPNACWSSTPAAMPAASASGSGRPGTISSAATPARTSSARCSRAR